MGMPSDAISLSWEVTRSDGPKSPVLSIWGDRLQFLTVVAKMY